MRKLMLVCAALLATLPAHAAVRYAFVGGGRVGAGFYGWGPSYGWGYGYGPFYGGPYGMYGPNLGEVKLDTHVKDAQVFLDGAYAGTAGKLKSMWLRPGKYNLEVRAPGQPKYAERIYVLGGKTLHVRPDLSPAARP